MSEIGFACQLRVKSSPWKSKQVTYGEMNLVVSYDGDMKYPLSNTSTMLTVKKIKVYYSKTIHGTMQYEQGCSTYSGQ